MSTRFYYILEKDGENVIFTKTTNKCVYLGRIAGVVVYIGRGSVGRAAQLLEGGHHSGALIDQVEVLGPFTNQESCEVETNLITLHQPKYNIYGIHPGSKRLFDENKANPKTRAIIECLRRGDWLADIARKFDTSIQNVHIMKSRYVPEYKKRSRDARTG